MSSLVPWLVPAWFLGYLLVALLTLLAGWLLLCWCEHEWDRHY